MGTTELPAPADVHSVKRDLPNQRVVRYDCKRTRALIFDLELQDHLQSLLTHYVKSESVQYKQGLNELAAPFVVLHTAGYPLERIHVQFTAFVERAMPNLHADDEFQSL